MLLNQNNTRRRNSYLVCWRRWRPCLLFSAPSSSLFLWFCERFFSFRSVCVCLSLRFLLCFFLFCFPVFCVGLPCFSLGLAPPLCFLLPSSVFVLCASWISCLRLYFFMLCVLGFFCVFLDFFCWVSSLCLAPFFSCLALFSPCLLLFSSLVSVQFLSRFSPIRPPCAWTISGFYSQRTKPFLQAINCDNCRCNGDASLDIRFSGLVNRRRWWVLFETTPFDC